MGYFLKVHYQQRVSGMDVSSADSLRMVIASKVIFSLASQLSTKTQTHRGWGFIHLFITHAFGMVLLLEGERYIFNEVPFSDTYKTERC